jgi:hypothetical protein
MRHWRNTILTMGLLACVAAAGCQIKTWGHGWWDTSTDESPDGGCPPGLTLCGGVCVDTDTDNGNCGACAAACPAGTVCNGEGSCQAECITGFTTCPGEGGASYCADLGNDIFNCGGCGQPCAGGDHAYPTCAAGQCGLACLDRYVDLDGSAANGCECAIGDEVCDGEDNDCDGSSDEDFDCLSGESRVCDLPEAGECEGTQTCTNACTWGECTSATQECDPGETRGCECDGTQTCNSSCRWDACVIGCEPPANACCEGICIDTQNDPANCGDCGVPCDDGNECTYDACITGICSPTRIDNRAVTCASESGICCGGECRIGGMCCIDADCPGGSEGSCEGTPTPCGDFGTDSAGCNAQHGCQWNGYYSNCQGTAVACEDMASVCDGCTCTWNPVDGTCGGSITYSCSGLGNVMPLDCEPCECRYAGTMPPGPCAAPSTYTCSLFSCATQDGCEWVPGGTATCGADYRCAVAMPVP